MIPLAILTVLFGLILYIWYSGKKQLPYPPGPKRLPIVGNLFSMPPEEEWVTYRKWSDEFGSDIIHTDVMGSHVMILNSIKAAHDLLDRRSTIYSDRRSDLSLRLNMDFNIAFMPYGPAWRHLRREFHINFPPTEIKVFRPFEQRAVHRLLRNLLSSPNNFSKHLRHMAGQIILSVAYGIDVRPEGDPYVEQAEKVLQALEIGTTQEASRFDTIPWLLHMPSWFPGARFKRRARKWCRIVDNALQTTHDKVKGDLASGTAAPSVSANMISKLDENSTDLDLLAAKGVPGTMYMAGTDTTVTALETFILAMTLYPEVQRKAQDEIDSVVGNSRLPDYSDQDTLPYIQAVLKEVLRWHPVTPLSVFHKAIKSDVYEGHFIPAGSIVIPNVWGMLHDPNIFTEPDRFHPERWFSPNVPAFPIQAFGFGARLCPGRVFARRSIWENIAGILAAFEIVPAEDGPPEKKYLSGLVSYVEPFRCHIRPRSEAAASLVRDTENEI
ncbi:cytochrome P450 [Russula vinacea]|nr:cytochrome P450 [Russula vinacea]